MSAALWLHDALVAGGCDPRPPVPGWERRGRPGLNARGVVAHHIGIAGTAIEPGLRLVTNGRPGLVNALCNVHLARDGRPRVVAAGVAWHAGSGGWKGLAGNASVLGVEAEGTTGQRETVGWHVGYKRTVAALLDGLGREAEMACAHAEWTTRKPDAWALLDTPGGMGGFRGRLTIAPLPPPLPPPEEDTMYATMPPSGEVGFALTHDKGQRLAMFTDSFGIGGRGAGVPVRALVRKADGQWHPLAQMSPQDPGMTYVASGRPWVVDLAPSDQAVALSRPRDDASTAKLTVGVSLYPR